MHATQLELTNFKRFHKAELDLNSKITLLLGPNSSGKSSIIKSLLGLKQTAAPSNEHEVFSAQGEYVDLGVYRDYVNNHDISKKVSIGISTAIPTNIFIPHAARLVRIDFTFGHDSTTEQARLLEIVAKDLSNNNSIFLRFVKKQTRDSFTLSLSKEYAEELLQFFHSKKEPDPKLVSRWTDGISVVAGDRYQFKPELKSNSSKERDFLSEFPVQVLTSIINSILKGFDSEFFYLGPLRRSPSRSYSRTAHLLSVGSTGEHTPSVLANLKSRASKERSREKPQGKRLEQLNRWIDLIFPGSKINAKSLEELVKLEIEREGGSKEVISDVGFGFSQVLPILVQAAVMPANSTLLIEQPELHLHPSAQTKFAEIISEASQSGRRFIIETHSEHIVRGLQISISNKRSRRGSLTNRLDREDLKIIYIPRSPQQVKVMEIDEWGEFLEAWPPGFFDEAYQASMRLLNNKIQSNEDQKKEIEKKQ